MVGLPYVADTINFSRTAYNLVGEPLQDFNRELNDANDKENALRGDKQDAGSVLTNIGVGVYNVLSNTVTSILYVDSHPLETIQGAGSAISSFMKGFDESGYNSSFSPADDFSMYIAEKLSEATDKGWNGFKEADSGTKIRLTTEFVGNIALIFVPMGGGLKSASYTDDVARLGNAAKAIDATSDAIRWADAMSDAAKFVDATSDTIRWADAASDAVKFVDATSDAAKFVDATSDAAKFVDATSDLTRISNATNNTARVVSPVDDVVASATSGSRQAGNVQLSTQGQSNLGRVTGSAASDATGSLTRGMVKSPSEIAQSWQGSGKYPGVDMYKDITIRKGDIIYRGEPNGTGFFTTKPAIEGSGRDATTVFEGLQVEKHPVHGYRSNMQGYMAIEDLDAALGIAQANPQFGKGGLPQVFVPDANDLINRGYLFPVDNIPLR